MDISLTIGRMFELTFQTFKSHFSYLLQLTAIFIVASFLLVLSADLLLTGSNRGTFFAVVFLYVVIYGKLAILVHRLILLNEKGLGYLFQWTSVEFKFIAWLLGVVMCFMVLVYTIVFAILPSNNVSGGAVFKILLVMTLGGLVISRLSMIFPATAAGDKLSLVESWQLTSNNKLSLFVMVILIPYFTKKILNKVPDGELIWSLTIEVVSVLVVIFEVALLSHCYETLAPKKDLVDDTK